MRKLLLHHSHDRWPKCDDDAANRASHYLDRDPLPDIPPALLGSASFADYARITGMVYPFRGVDKSTGKYNEGLVKPASYEVRPGDSFFYFDRFGYRRDVDISDNAVQRFITLRANSITFCSTDERFRLPNYIAMRFNLRIKHVHRGILLGTGPLVDPGFDRKLLIPLHNLTDTDYIISLDEGLIWVEFTKVYLQPKADIDNALTDVGLPRNTQKDFEKFFMHASGGHPIRSSIPTAVRAAEEKSDLAMTKVDRLEREIRTVSIAGIIAIILALFAIVLPILDLIKDFTPR